jgi:ribosome-binding factor A
MTQRTSQLGSVLHRAVQMVIERGLSDPRIKGVVSVTEVRVSPDLKNATVLVSVIPPERQKTTLHGLQSATRLIRRRAGELVAMRVVPALEFRADDRIKKEAAVLGAINSAIAELDEEQDAGAEDDVDADTDTGLDSDLDTDDSSHSTTPTPEAETT